MLIRDHSLCDRVYIGYLNWIRWSDDVAAVPEWPWVRCIESVLNGCYWDGLATDIIHCMDDTLYFPVILYTVVIWHICGAWLICVHWSGYSDGRAAMHERIYVLWNYHAGHVVHLRCVWWVDLYTLNWFAWSVVLSPVRKPTGNYRTIFHCAYVCKGLM